MPPSEIGPDEQVLVLTKSGEKAGTVIERWYGPVTGESYVVDVGGGIVIASVAHVRRPSESERLLMGLKVYNGMTGAGCKTLKEARTEPWTCANGHENKPSHTRCFTLGCNLPRDPNEHA